MIRAANAWSNAGIWLRDAIADVVVMIPAAVGERDKAHAGFHQPPRQQQALAGRIAAVFVAQFVRSLC